MGLLDTLSVGRRALGAASAGIDVTSQNVANVETAGYSRRRLITSTADPVYRSGGWLGSGVNVDGVERQTDRFISERLVEAAGSSSEAATKESVLGLAETYFDEQSQTGVHGSLSDVYDALSALTADPSDEGGRLAAVAAAEDFAGTVNRVAQGLEDGMEDIDDGVDERLSTINSNLAKIAALNKRIGKSGNALGPADLLDQRDQLIREVGDLAGATVDFSSTGQATVFIGGHAVVSGKDARTLTSSVDSSGELQVFVDIGSGTAKVTSDIGGEIGGLVGSRESMESWLSDLDDIVEAVADAFNTQHALGFDQNGTAGGDIFTYTSTDPSLTIEVDASLADDASLLALAGASTAAAGDDDNLQALLDIEETAILGGLTGEEAISGLVSSIGSDVASAAADADSLEYQLADVQTMWDAVAQVDLDEEAIQLVALQTAYTAAARVITAADQLLQTLMNIGA